MEVIDIKEYKEKVKELKDLAKTIGPLLEKMDEKKELKFKKETLNNKN